MYLVLQEMVSSAPFNRRRVYFLSISQTVCIHLYILSLYRAFIECIWLLKADTITNHLLGHSHSKTLPLAIISALALMGPSETRAAMSIILASFTSTCVPYCNVATPPSGKSERILSRAYLDASITNLSF